MNEKKILYGIISISTIAKFNYDIELESNQFWSRFCRKKNLFTSKIFAISKMLANIALSVKIPRPFYYGKCIRICNLNQMTLFGTRLVKTE
jgi:hypothetical protein